MIAVILLLMMTVAGAGAAFFWFIRIQSETQGGTESYSESLSEKVSAKISILTIEYDQTGFNNTFGNATDGYMNLTILLKNIGNTTGPIVQSTTAPTTTFTLLNNEQHVICTTGFTTDTYAIFGSEGCGSDLDVREIQKIVFSMN